MGIPLVAPIVSGVVDGLVGAAVFGAVNNYITKSTSTGPATPVIPTSKKSTSKASAKTAQKQALGNYATGVGGVLAGAAAAIGTAVTSGKNNIEASSAAQSAKTSQLLTASNASPLLTNQVFMKDSIDKLIDAINASSLITASVFGTLDANLSAIGSSLTSISATIIEVSDNYSRELNNTDDLPYINQDDYYEMLRDSGMPFFETQDLIRQENMLFEALSAQGLGYDDIKAQIQNWRKNIVPPKAQDAVEKEMVGITRTPRVNSEGQSASSASSAPELTNLEKWAASALAVNEAVTVDMYKRNIHAQVEKNEYVTTASDIKDLDGNTIASIKPIEAQSMKNITDARLRTDMNNFEVDEFDFDDMFGSDMPDITSIFNFAKKSDRIQEVMNGLVP